MYAYYYPKYDPKSLKNLQVQELQGFREWDVKIHPEVAEINRNYILFLQTNAIQAFLFL